MARSTNRREVDQRRIDEMPYPSAFPAYRRVIVDSRDRIWLQLYAYPGTAENLWMVLDRATKEAKTVRLPAQFLPFVIGAREVLGTWQDTDGVAHVRSYRLLL
jgi:hypothetical protein